MYGYVYITTNLVNNKKYIGQHRGQFDSSYIGSGTLMLKAIHKYGKENFTCQLLESCSSKEELNEREQYWVSYFSATEDDKYYNISKGGEGGIGRGKGSYWEDEDKRKAAIEKQRKSSEQYFSAHPNIRAGQNNSMYGRKHSKETLKKISEGRKNSEGVQNSPRFKGHHHTEEAKKKISESMKGKVWVTNGVEDKMIYPKELDAYTSNGYYRGRENDKCRKEF